MDITNVDEQIAEIEALNNLAPDTSGPVATHTFFRVQFPDRLVENWDFVSFHSGYAEHFNRLIAHMGKDYETWTEDVPCNLKCICLDWLDEHKPQDSPDDNDDED